MRLTCCLLAILVCAGCGSSDPFIRGTNDAKKHLGDGNFIVRIQNGFFAPDADDYSKILEKEYGIDQEISMGEEKEYDAGYNEIMIKAIKEKHGKDVFDVAHEKARGTRPSSGTSRGTQPD